ncbi:TPM domain-containing protein [Flavobacteriaceae bacterium D16]|nr:TPM domain-containing protein [Flavobacteriaceae bacterium D16]
MRFRGVSILFLFLSWNVLLGQFDIPEKPTVQTSVYDYVNLLSETQKSNLEQKLIRYADSTSTQIVAIIIDTTEGEDINFLGAQWGQKWGFGQAEKDNGILILLAEGDRRIAIQTGYGVEEFLTDAMCNRIIKGRIIPEFRDGDYYGGLNAGADAIFEVLTGQFEEGRSFGKSKEFPFGSILPFIIFVVIIIILSARNRRGGGGRRGGRKRGLDLWDVIILSNMGRGGYRGSSGGGFGSGGSFGGGFSGGFGGGGFGGGGASGGW